MNTGTDLLTIDGSYGEGGGQVIRTSVALSAITGRPIQVINLRAGRATPGLKTQHVVSVKSAAELCAAEVQGGHRGSMELSFTPTHPVKAGRYRFEIETAGATTLVAQTVFVPLALAEGESEVTITGGTHCNFAPSADFFEQVFLRAMASAGIRTEFEIVRFGFVPGGKGEVTFTIQGGVPIRGLDLSRRGRLKQASARVIVSKHLPEMVAARGKRELQRLTDLTPHVFSVDSVTPGAASHVACEFDDGFAGFVGLGERGKPMEKVVAECGDGYRALLKTDASTDEHLADQLVLPLAFADGPSKWITPNVTEHLRTVIWVVKQFYGREITLEERDDRSGIVTIA